MGISCSLRVSSKAMSLVNEGDRRKYEHPIIVHQLLARSTTFNEENSVTIVKERPTIISDFPSKYQPSSDRQIHSSESLREPNWQSIGDPQETQDVDVLKGVSPERGSTGVFDIEEFVEIIKREKLIDIAVIAVPPQLNYVDYMVISTGKSAKQMTAVAEFIRKIFKVRASPSDSLPVIEGKNNKDWIALDLGNIAFHVFSAKTRALYDLETLWTCGAEFDDLSNQEDQSFPILQTRLSFPSQTP
uniref:Mitochondrial assembly of ribosomal large subunit protein 1 n=1 Tax=Scapholeberis mucronata TaxID=202097 RepID=A0A4Y7NKL4_9CRUS|nr:EOG090X0AI9 [Scapholeberis mucronata]